MYNIHVKAATTITLVVVYCLQCCKNYWSCITINFSNRNILFPVPRHLLSYLLTQWNSVPLEKLTSSQLVKKFPAFYRTRKFITAFTSARQLSLSCSRSIQSIPPHPNSWRSILILSYHLRLDLPSGLFPSGFLPKSLYIPLLSPYMLHFPPNCQNQRLFPSDSWNL